MRKVVGAAAALAGLFVLALPFTPWWPFDRRHGHIYEPLRIDVRLVERASGTPLTDGTVAVARGPWLFEGNRLAQWTGYAWEALYLARPDHWRAPVCVAGVDREGGTTTVATAACVTRYWRGEALTAKYVMPPRFLVVDHPRLGRTIHEIEAEATPAGEPDTWRLDLGTVAVGP